MVCRCATMEGGAVAEGAGSAATAKAEFAEEADAEDDRSSGNSANDDCDYSSTESLEDEYSRVFAYADEVGDFIRCLKRNFKGTVSIDLDYFTETKWDGLEDRCPHLKTKEDYEGVINADIMRLFYALEKNTVVRKVTLGLHSLYGCKINDSAAVVIAMTLSNPNTSVEELEISADCFLRAKGIRIVLEGLMNNNKIKKLTIMGHVDYEIYEANAPMGILGRKLSSILAEFIIKSTSLQELVLERNPIYWDRCLLILCNALSNNKSIKRLSLLDNLFLNANEIKELCKAVGSKTGIKVQEDVGTDLIHLVEGCRNISELRVVFPRRDVLNTQQWRQLSSAFKGITYTAIKGEASIRSIHFQNDLMNSDPFDVQALSVLKSIATGTKVEKLVFQDLPINDDTMKAICAALSPSKYLREVTFRDCGNKTAHLTVYGANCLADLLRKCESIENIHLTRHKYGYHQITDEGAVNIARAVSDRRGTTRELSLYNCGFGNEGGLALRQLLDAPTNTLERLDIGCNSFDDPSLIKSFAACIQKSSALLSLGIGGSREGWGLSTEVDVQIHLVRALRDNQLLQRLSLPYSKDTTTEDQKALKHKILRELLQVNHSITDLCAFEDSYVLRNMLRMNKKHPILASIIKEAPFPAYLIKDISGGVLANALERADDVAGIDGVFSLLRQVSDSIAADEDTRKRSKED